MKTIIDALIEISLYAAVITGALMLFRGLFYKRLSPKLQYLAWGILVLRLMLPFTIESGFHMESLFPAAAQSPAAELKTPFWFEPVSAAQPQAEPIAAGSAPAAQAAVQPPAQVFAPGSQAPLKGYAVAFWVWVFGMGLYAAWMAFVGLRFRRRIMGARIETPVHVLALYERCRQELGVSRRLVPFVVNAAISPGIAFFGRPALLLPASMLDSDEALRFALMHELTHQKRGDHIVSALVNLLRMVYWFNPVVHFAFSQMQSDMETACDRDVTRSLRPDEKRAYLTTIIDLFSLEAQPLLGMSGFHTKRMAQRRMKGAFMRKTSATGTKISAALLAAVLLAACFTTACQKAPSGGTAHIETAGSGAASIPAEAQLRARYAFTCGSWGGADDNIRRAAQLINAGGGITVQPGEEWSFADALGPFTQDNGWTFAPGADDGEDVWDERISGVCCVSTALYGALLSGDIEITERRTHAWPFAYVPAGLDAAVSTGGPDLKFVNNTSEPLTIRCAVTDAYMMDLFLAIELWGEPLPENTSYALRSVVVETTPSDVRYVDDPTLPQGMEKWITGSHNGQKVEVYRDALNVGAVSSTELLYTDEYRAVTGVYARGTKVPVPLSDRSKAELFALAKLYQSKYTYDSGAHDFEEVNLHYVELFDELEVHFGGIINGEGTTGLTVGVPMQEFDLKKCYPYAAVLFALDPALKGMSIGSLKYDSMGQETVHLERADVESYYSSVLERPLLDYAKSEKLLAEMMIASAGYR